MGNDFENLESFAGKNSQLSRSTKLLSTASIFYGNICFGAVLTCYGPAVADFEIKYDTDVDTVSKVFTITTVGYLIGALLTGFVYNFLNRQLGVIILLSGMGAAVYLTPHCSTLTLLFCVSGLLGVCSGAYDSSQMVWMLEIWQDKAGPYVQTQHFFYALGSIIPPLLLAPFLTKSNEEEEGDGAVSTTTVQPSRNPDMWIPFTIIGALCTIAVLFQSYLFIFKRYVPPPPEVGRFDSNVKNEVSSDAHNDKDQGFLSSFLRSRRLKLIILSAIFMGTNQGMEMCTQQFMPTFASKGDLDLTDSQGAYITSGLQGAFTLGRFLGIFAVLKTPPQFMILFAITTITGANVILLLFANSSLPMLWVGSILIGFGFATTLASFCVYIERHLAFTNIIGSIMVITGSGIASIYPLVIGKTVETNNRVLTYVNFFSLFWMVVAGSLIYKLTYKNAKKLDKE